jgi:hypothetical protein
VSDPLDIIASREPLCTYARIRVCGATEANHSQFAHEFGTAPNIEMQLRAAKARIEELEMDVLMATPEIEWNVVNEMLRAYSLRCSVTFTESGLDEITNNIMDMFGVEWA